MFFCVSVFFFVSLYLRLFLIYKKGTIITWMILENYATKHLGMNGMVLDDVIKSQAGYLNPISWKSDS